MNISDINLALDEYYVEHNAFRGAITLAIERTEIEALLPNLNWKYADFCRIVSAYWAHLDITSSIDGHEYLAIGALQVAAGFKPDALMLPCDAAYTKFLFAALGQDNSPANVGYFFYGNHQRNLPHAGIGITKQDYLWKALRSHFKRTHGLKLFIPEAKVDAGRFVHYPKAHLLFREAELQHFAGKFRQINNYIDHLAEANIDTTAFRTWPAFSTYFPQAARNRVANESIPEKLPLYADQARRYLARLTEADLLRQLETDQTFNTATKLRRLRAARQNFTPHFLERNWDEDFELFVDGLTPILIEPTQWSDKLYGAIDKELAKATQDFVFVQTEDSTEVFDFVGLSLRTVQLDAPVVVVSAEHGRAETRVQYFDRFDAFAQARDLPINDAQARTRPPRASLRGGLRTSREATFFPGLGPELVLPKGYETCRAQNLTHADVDYESINARSGMWKIDVAKQQTRFSIEPREPKFVTPAIDAFDLVTFGYQLGYAPNEAGFFKWTEAPEDTYVDLLAGSKRSGLELISSDVQDDNLISQPAPLLPEVHGQLFDPNHVGLFEPLTRQPKLPDASVSETPNVEPLRIAALFRVQTGVWEGDKQGSIQGIEEMLDKCYPSSGDGLAQRLYDALNQTSPVVVADVAQGVALAKTTGSSATYVSSPYTSQTQVGELHRNLVRHAVKDARRSDGNETRFVFVIVDLSTCEAPLLQIDRISRHYGIFETTDGVPRLPHNLYLTFVLGVDNRRALQDFRTDHAPVFFASGGWGIPVAGALAAYTPNRFFAKTASHASA